MVKGQEMETYISENNKETLVNRKQFTLGIRYVFL